MIEEVLRVLSKSASPALRERYLARVRTVQGADARRVEERLAQIVARDRRQAS